MIGLVRRLLGCGVHEVSEDMLYSVSLKVSSPIAICSVCKQGSIVQHTEIVHSQDVGSVSSISVMNYCNHCNEYDKQVSYF